VGLVTAIITAIISALVSALVSAFFLTVFQAQPQVPTSNGQRFFYNYYSQVTQADRRMALFQEDLTPYFQSLTGGWHAYNSWWETQKQVIVDRVESVPGNPLEFTVWLTYNPVHGSPETEVTSFSLVCNGRWASLLARIPTLGCPVSHLQIQSGLNVPTSEG
jgi:hypothetical protein